MSSAEPSSNEFTSKINDTLKLRNETKMLRDTLDLLWNKTLEQQKLCEQSEKENEYLQDYINSLMTASNVLDKK